MNIYFDVGFERFPELEEELNKLDFLSSDVIRENQDSWKGMKLGNAASELNRITVYDRGNNNLATFGFDSENMYTGDRAKWNSPFTTKKREYFFGKYPEGGGLYYIRIKPDDIKIRHAEEEASEYVSTLQFHARMGVLDFEITGLGEHPIKVGVEKLIDDCYRIGDVIVL